MFTTYVIWKRGTSVADVFLHMPPLRYLLVPSVAATQFDKLPAPVQRLARLCDGTRTLTELSTVSRLPQERTSAIIDRLTTLGVITSATKKVRQRRDTPPTVTRWLTVVEAQQLEPAQRPEPEATPEPEVLSTSLPEPVRLTSALPEALPPQPDPHFTAEEESFFASSIDHLVSDEFSR
jgi:hypothetical protein